MAICIPIFSYVNVKGMEFPEESSTGLDFSETSNVVELSKGKVYNNNRHGGQLPPNQIFL